MSERWQGSQNDDEQQSRTVSRSELDMAARYASQLRELHEKCEDDPKFYMKILGYSEVTERTRDSMRYSATISRPEAVSNRPISTARQGFSSRPSFDGLYSQPQNSTFYQQRMMRSNEPSNSIHGPATSLSNLSNSSPSVEDQSRYFMPQVPETPPSLTDMSISHMVENRSESEATGRLIGIGERDEILQDELSVMSQLLLGQQFLDLDRVITLEGTDFDFNVGTWGNPS